MVNISTKSLSSADQSNYVFLRVVFRNQRKNNALDTIVMESGVDASMVNDAAPKNNQNLILGVIVKISTNSFSGSSSAVWGFPGRSG